MHDKNQDETRPITDFVLPSQKYKLLQNAYRNLRDELERWNIEALTEGAEKKPYEQEVVDLNRMINWGERELMNASFSINVKGISIRSLRYAKTALLFFLATKNKEVQKKRQEGWPERVVNSLGETTIEVKEIEQKIEYTPFDFLPDLIPNYTPNYTPKSNSLKWDVFVSHASEDKDEFVRPLAYALQSRGLKVWYDEFTLKVGDSLRRSIDHGLANSNYGAVVVSPSFLKKEWPQKELDALFSLEVDGRKLILPIWHNIEPQDVKNYSTMLADRKAISSVVGIEKIASILEDIIKEN